MKKMHSLLLILVTSLLVGCGTTSTVPLTGRKQNLLVTDAQVLALSNQQYKEYMSKAIPSTNKQNTEMVKRVGNRLATAVQNYLIQNGRAEEIKNYAWEFNLVQDKNVNAFCMPGGKIVVYEGLLPYTKDEASLAIVLGHEIAHAVARHSAEQMSKRMKAQYGATALSAILGATTNSSWQALGNEVFGFGANSVLRKFSRNHESEADYMGLIFAAMAGYDPTVAVAFWQRMAASGGSKPAEFFSDHPSDEHRILAIQKDLPEALKYYKPQQHTSASAFSVSSPQRNQTTPGAAKKKQTTKKRR